MEITSIKQKFPQWGAAVTLAKTHGEEARAHAAAAAQAPDQRTRLEASVRAMMSFDNALDAARSLPISIVVPGADYYGRGYDQAVAAVTSLIANGAMKGASELVGRQALHAARDALHAGVDVASTDLSPYGTKLAVGWISSALGDARVGAKMLGEATTTGRDILVGLSQLRVAAEYRRELDIQLIQRVEGLLEQADSELTERAARASEPAAAV